MHLAGFQPATADEEGPVLELRDCPRCGSTRARPVPSLRYMLRLMNRYIRLRRLLGAGVNADRLKEGAR